MAEKPGQSLRVQVCHIAPERQFLRELELPPGTTLETAIRQSGILEALPELDLGQARVGIHGALKSLDTLLRPGDRVEIYRPLLADPKEARRRRARRAGKSG